jgi:hypothetical protein
MEKLNSFHPRNIRAIFGAPPPYSWKMVWKNNT